MTDKHPAARGIILAATLLFQAAPGHAQSETAAFKATPELTLSVPTTAVALGCAAVADGAAAEQQTVRQTFVDNFETFTLSNNRWTPHYDGGYDAASKQWQGYDWRTKRTAPGLKEQEIYVDPLYKGTSKQALGLNPFSVRDGVLRIEALRTPEEMKPLLFDFPYTSGMLTTRRSFLQHQGYFEMRAKVPAGDSLVPAFWLLPFDKSWPPELDIMEAPGSEPDKIVTTVHWKTADGKQKASGCRNVVPGFDHKFHLYGALWNADRIVYYIDRKPVAQIATPPGFDLPMYMLVNLAVGGTWAGNATPRTPIPSTYEIDWIAAYSTPGKAACETTDNGVLSCEGKAR